MNLYAEYVELWDFVPTVWQSHLEHVRQDINSIGQHLDWLQERGIEFQPRPERIFAGFDISPECVQVVILGQDPYPTLGHATGLAFSVPGGTHPLPATLRNILAEVDADYGPSICRDGDLHPWHEQGVLLLNRVLTVQVGQSDSHKSLGWQTISEAVVEAVVKVNPEVIGVLWGRQAQQLRGHFLEDYLVESVHPSPLSAYRGFVGSKPFIQVNQLLVSQGKTPIHW